MHQHERAEIEEEANVNQNNGLPIAKHFDQLLESGDNAPILLFQIVKKSVTKKGEHLVTQYNIEVFMNSVSIFYNRLLISRAQTFINQATVNKVQNAAAEADFEHRLKELRDKTQKKVNNILEKSEITLSCNAKGFEILVPDNTNYEDSKFMQLQSGNIVIKNNGSRESKSNDRSLFMSYICQHHQDLEQTLTMTTNEEYSLTCYDFQILYIPSLSHLENLQYTDSDHQRYSILKKTDIQVDLKNDHESNISHVLTSIGSLEVQLTNKELKELKNFIDNLSQYH